MRVGVIFVLATYVGAACGGTSLSQAEEASTSGSGEGTEGFVSDLPPDMPLPPTGCATLPEELILRTTGDFDGDGATDLLFVPRDAEEHPVQTRVAYSDGDCEFTLKDGPSISSFQAAMGHYYAVADFNGDGVDDLLGVQESLTGYGETGPFVTALGRPDRSFEAEVNSPVEDLNIETWSVDWIDLDGDGRKELVIGEPQYGSSVALVLEVNELGAVSLQRREAVGGYCFLVDSAVADFDGDGVDDLVLAGAWPTCNGSAPDTPLVMWNGAAVPELEETIVYGGEGYPRLSNADLDGDGWSDLTANFDDGRYVFLGGPGGLGPRQVVPSSDFGACSLAFVGRLDLNGDGVEQLVGYLRSYTNWTTDEVCEEEVEGFVEVDFVNRNVGPVWPDEHADNAWAGGVSFYDLDGDGGVERVWSSVGDGVTEVFVDTVLLEG